MCARDSNRGWFLHCHCLLWPWIDGCPRLSAWLDNKDSGLSRSRTTKAEVREANTVCLQAILAVGMKVLRHCSTACLHEWVGRVAWRGELLLPAVVAIVTVCVLRAQCCLDDPHLIATAGLRLGSLLKDKQDFLGGVQVVRATLAKVQQYRDAAVAQTVFGAPSSPGAVAGTEAPASGAGAPGAASGTSDGGITGPSAADQAALSFASATALLPIDTESGLSARAGALASNGAGLFGPGSKVSRESHATTTTCDGLQSTVL